MTSPTDFPRARARVRGLGHEGGVGWQFSRGPLWVEQCPEPVCGDSGRILEILALLAQGGVGTQLINQNPTRIQGRP